jgi:hypothetical protein
LEVDRQTAKRKFTGPIREWAIESLFDKTESVVQQRFLDSLQPYQKIRALTIAR